MLSKTQKIQINHQNLISNQQQIIKAHKQNVIETKHFKKKIQTP